MFTGSILLFCFLLLVHGADGSTPVFSVDLGSQFFKVAIVKPGVPMEIALNRESDRKTPLAVSIRGKGQQRERKFGEPALALAVRFPRLVYVDFLALIGKPCCDHPTVREFLRLHPYYELKPHPETGTVVFKHDDDTDYSVEELFAMILEDAKSTAEGFSEAKMNDVVITVPPYFGQAERRAVLRAATNYTGLNVLQLLNSNTAVALNFGVFRRDRFNTSRQYYLIFDMGSSSTIATLVGYELVKNNDLGYTETVPQLTVLGVGFDSTLGTRAFIDRLTTNLAKTFNGQKKSNIDVLKDHKAMIRIWKAAEDTMQVLSANADDTVHVEGLVEEKDYSAKMSRKEFEEINADLYDRIKNPIHQALKSAQLESFDLISEVMLMGGGTRIPKVQEILMKVTNKKELGKSLNTDEAGAMGAVYQAATLSKAYRVKRFLVRDAVLFPIVVEFERAARPAPTTPPEAQSGDLTFSPSSGDADQNSNEEKIEEKKKNSWLKRVIFSHMNPYPLKKIITFGKFTEDFSFYVNHGPIDFLVDSDLGLVSSMNLSAVQVSGVGKLYSEAMSESPAVVWNPIKGHLSLDDNGILNVLHVDANFERPAPPASTNGESTLSKIGSAFTNLFSSSDSANADSDNASNATLDSKEPQDQNATNTNGSTNATSPANSTSNATADEPKPLVILKTLDIQVQLVDLNDPDEAEIQSSATMISELRIEDEERRALEKAKNDLEAYMIDLREHLEDSLYIKCSTVKERESVSAMLSEISTWYDDESSIETPKAEYDTRLKALKKAMTDIQFRVTESKGRPEALKVLRDMVNRSEFFLITVRNLSGKGEEFMFTDGEYTAFELLVNNTKDWEQKTISEVKTMRLDAKPSVLIQDINSKAVELDREVKYLLQRAKAWRPPKPKVTPNATDSSSEDTSDSKTTSDDDSDSDEDFEQPEGDNGQGESGEGMKLEFPPSEEEVERAAKEEAKKAKKEKQEDAGDDETLQLDSGTETPAPSNTKQDGKRHPRKHDDL